MNSGGLLRTVRQRWAVVLACVGVALLVTFMVTPANPTSRSLIGSYTATATLLQTSADSTSSGKPSSGGVSLPSIALFVTTGEIPKLSADQLGYKGDPAILASEIRVTTDPTVGAIRISSTSSDGEHAANTANVFADQTVAFFSRMLAVQRMTEVSALEERVVQISGALAAAEKSAKADPNNEVVIAERDAQRDRYQSAYRDLQDLKGQAGGQADLAVLQRATPVPNVSNGGFTAPASRTGRLGIAVLLGLALGVGLAYLLERSDARIRTRDDVLDNLSVPVIAEVPKMTREERREAEIQTISKPLGTISEAYRSARSSILLTASRPISDSATPPANSSPAHAGNGRVFLVTSAHAREGKSTSVANLAVSIAETGRSVIVLDADFRAPNLPELLDVLDGSGISDYLQDPRNVSFEALARPTCAQKVRLVQAGTRLEHPAILPSQMAPVVAAAQKLADIVLIDTAPMMHANDVQDMLPLVDAVVLVVRSGRLNTATAGRLVDKLRRVQVPIAGAILIGARSNTRWRYGYGSYRRYGSYGYGSSDGRSSDRHRASTKAALPSGSAGSAASDTAAGSSN